jgi:PAS domain S-box-containing protein
MVAEKITPEEEDAGARHIKRSLRDDAEKELARSPKRSPGGTGLTTEALNHELQVYQIELEMQVEELRIAHLKLEKSRDKYLDLFEFAPLGYLTLNNQALITGINHTGAALLGVERSRLVNARFRRFIAPADLDPWDRFFIHVLKKEGKLTCTLLLVRGDGSVFPARLEAVRTSGSDGTPTVRIAISDISEIRLAESEKAENDSFNRGLVENLPDYIIIYGPDGKIRYVNPSSARALGYDADSLIGTSLLAYVAEEYQDTVISRLARRQEGGDVPPYEIEILIPGGLRRSVIVKGTHIEYHATPATLLVLIDITERKRMETALRESERRLRQITDTITSVFYVHNRASGQFIYVSPAYEKIWKRSCQSLLDNPLSFLEAVHPGDLPRLQESIRRELKENIYVDKDYRIIQPDGTIRWIRSRNFPVINEEGIVYRVAGIAEDITERKEAEEALQESEKRYRDMFELNRSVMLIINPETGRIVNANSAASQFYGYSREEFSRLVITDINISDPAITMKDMSHAVGNQGASFAFRHRKKNGEISNVDVFSAPITLGGQRLLHSIIQDVTERTLAEEALRVANRKLNLLSGITRHDIRNQLLALGGYLEISKSSLNDPVATSEFIAKEEKIAETIAHQITFTKDYEDLGVKVPVWQNINEILKKVPPRLPMHTIRLDAEDSLPEIYADPLLEKVFFNLIDNALRYGGEKMTVIRVTSQQDSRGRIIAIEDDGNGISGEDKKQLFTRGFGKHTGLGLYLSREILSITGITITETGMSGTGARFEIMVPNGMWRTAGTGRNPD